MKASALLETEALVFWNITTVNTATQFSNINQHKPVLSTYQNLLSQCCANIMTSE